MARRRVTGLDLNEAMLTVARRLRPDLEWRQGDAAALPFPDAAFDVALCQSGADVRPGPGRGAARDGPGDRRGRDGRRSRSGASPDRQLGFRPLADAVARHAGPDAVDLIGTYFRLGDPDEFTRLCAAAGLR